MARTDRTLMTRDCLFDIERDLIDQYRALDKYDPYAVQGWYWSVAGWLIQAPDEDTRQRWIYIFSMEMCKAHGATMPQHLCAFVLLHYVDRELQRRGYRRDSCHTDPM